MSLLHTIVQTGIAPPQMGRETLPLLALGLIATLARLRLDSGAADA